MARPDSDRQVYLSLGERVIGMSYLMIAPVCGICLESLNQKEKDDWRKLEVAPCGHIFHSTCVREWRRRTPSCPCCRTYLGRGSLRRVYIDLVNDPSLDLDERLRTLSCEVETERRRSEDLDAQLKEAQFETRTAKLDAKATACLLECERARHLIARRQLNSLQTESSLVAGEWEKKAIDAGRELEELKRRKDELVARIDGLNHVIASIGQRNAQHIARIQELERRDRDNQALVKLLCGRVDNLSHTLRGAHSRIDSLAEKPRGKIV